MGVDLIVLDQGVDTSTPAGRLLFNVLAAIGEFEVELIRERTRAGVDAARRRGAEIGRPRATDKRTRDRIQRLRFGGASIRQIADVVDVSKSTVQRVLAT